MRRKNLLVTYSVASVLASAPLPAIAQSLPSGRQADAASNQPAAQAPSVNDTGAEASDKGDIIVTAQRREQSVNNVPMAINVLTAADLGERRVEGLRDLALSVPGLRFNDLNGGVPVYIIRGVGFNDSSLMATSAVAIYHDDVALPFPVMTRGPLYDIQRTEVLKGPQGTLFGRNATGGALNIITRGPSDKLDGYAEASYGRFGTLELEGGASVPLAPGLGFRLAGKTIQSSEGWQHSLSRDESLGKKDQIGLRGTLAAEFGANLSATLRVDWWRDRSDTQAPTLVRINPGVPTNTPIINLLKTYAIIDNSESLQAADWQRGSRPRYNEQNVNVSLAASLKLAPDVTLTSLTSYDHFDQPGSYFNRDGFGGVPLVGSGAAAYIPVADVAGGYVPPAYLDNSYLGSEGKIDSFAQELRVNGHTGFLTFVAGGYYSRDTVAQVFHLSLDLSTNSNNLGNNATAGFNAVDSIARQSSTSWSGFIHTEWQVAPTLNLTAAARYTKDSSNFSGCTRDVFGGLAAAFRVQRGQCITLDTTSNTRGSLIYRSQDEQSLAYRLGVDYRLASPLLVYATYSRGFKPGSYPNLSATVSVQYNPVRQERLDAYEVGTKFTLPDRLGQFNVSAFYYDYKDRQLNTKVQTSLGSLYTLANIPHSSVKGVEAELRLRPASGLSVTLNGSYTRTRVGDFISFTQSGLVPVNFAGSAIPFVPEFQGTAAVSYTRPIRSSLEAFISSDLTYSGSFNTDYAGVTAPLDPTYHVNSYALLGLSVGLGRQDKGWRISLWARNLTNSFYATNVLRTVDTDIRLNGIPRMYGVAVSSRF